jgi:hypothetical protein
MVRDLNSFTISNRAPLKILSYKTTFFYYDWLLSLQKSFANNSDFFKILYDTVKTNLTKQNQPVEINLFK